MESNPQFKNCVILPPESMIDRYGKEACDELSKSLEDRINQLKEKELIISLDTYLKKGYSIKIESIGNLNYYWIYYKGKVIELVFVSIEASNSDVCNALEKILYRHYYPIRDRKNKWNKI